METKSETTGKYERVIKVVVIGPESTGKSSLCTELSKYYSTIWCPEYAREYLLKNGMNYSYDDLLSVARGQLRKEDEYTGIAGKTTAANDINNSQPLLFIDTDMYVMKVWCEFVFGSCHQWILDQIVLRRYDLYLLCNIDLPWQKDELREYPDLATREKLYHMYRDTMLNQSVPWVDIRGDYSDRLQTAIRAVDELKSNVLK